MNDLAARRTVATINLSAIQRNITRLNERISPPDALCCVVKADAYGHGAAQIALTAQKSGVQHFAVASTAEAVALRSLKITGDIYIMSPFMPDEAETVAKYDLIPFVSDYAQIQSLVKAAKYAPLPARMFLIVDTGMGREGFLPDAARFVWNETCKQSVNVRISGIGTHFACASEPNNPFTMQQTEGFDTLLRRIAVEFTDNDDGRGNKGVWITYNNSPAFLNGVECAHMSGVRGHIMRIGIALYGISPFENALSGFNLERVMDWTAKIALVRTIPAGNTIGYGRTHMLSADTTVATISVGYADGLPRRLSNTGHVLIRGKTAPVVGRVSMDQAAVDISHIPDAKLGDMVTILGDNGRVTQSADQIARLLDTTPHEITCGITRRVPRRYI